MQDSLPQALSDLLPLLLNVGFCLLGTVFVGVVIYSSYRRMQATGASWQDLAMRTGLSYQAGNFMMLPSLSGDFRRRPLSLHSFTRGSGKSRTRYTRVSVTLKTAIEGSFSLHIEGFLAGVGKALGMQDVQLGSERFDKSFVIKGKPPEFVQIALGDPMLQDSLIRLRERTRFSLAMEGGSLSYTEVGLPKDVDYLESVFNTVSDLADRLEGGTKSSSF